MVVFQIRTVQADRQRVNSRPPGFQIHSKNSRTGGTFRLKSLDDLSILLQLDCDATLGNGLEGANVREMNGSAPFVPGDQGRVLHKEFRSVAPTSDRDGSWSCRGLRGWRLRTI